MRTYRQLLSTRGPKGLVALAALVALSCSAIAAPAEKTKARSLFAPSPKVSTSKPKANAKPAARTVAKETSQAGKIDYVMRLDVTAKSGQSIEEAYFEYFSNNQVHPKVVRAKLRRLADKKQFEEAVAVLRSAVRSGQIQPWMYEALGLMMEAARMPRDEIERTLMSAADFAKSPQEMIYLADYMERLKFPARALELLENVSQQAPDMSEPYIRGLELAKYLKDDEALKWSTLGILRQEWPQGQRAIRAKARFTALALVKRLRKKGEEQQADQFAKRMNDALVRDVVVRVSWAGEADVDLMIEEPSGTVCSYRQPRTAGGGILVGDLNSKFERSTGDGYSEIYVCPEGFAGTYRLMLRQVWGRVPGGKVSVDVWTHGGTQGCIHFHKVVPVDEQEGGLVAFDLEEGRRKQSLEQQQLANDLMGQLAVNRAVLAQQINALASSRAVQAQQIGNQVQQPFVIGNTPVVDPRRGPVGFRPEIIVLPTGATLSTNAVISADRRYVRITALPFFSGVTAVTQFNLTQGVTGIDTDLGGIDIDIGVDRDNDADLDAGVDAG